MINHPIMGNLIGHLINRSAEIGKGTTFFSFYTKYYITLFISELFEVIKFEVILISNNNKQIANGQFCIHILYFIILNLLNIIL